MQDGEGVAHAVGFRAVEHLEAVVLVEADGLARSARLHPRGWRRARYGMVEQE